ncbi:pyrroline-5-carboxylate reductase [Ensifer adhaerens]|uniref:Pyrroline-5-carboxylate reductase n=1 Tax=Ensifer adhaerens TaxID=106592 RepID=A0A0L8BK74_ENSAD|nr:pyrroline-5-carboxylate reductase dimerization domain-containing protein [Ensifer adhaerens]KOF14964.1 pyrroline-5-carboxylate reductase [Ensifer adhaerens]
MNGRLRVGIVGGAGWLGGAIAEALLDAGVVTSDGLSLSYRSNQPERFPSSFWTVDNQALADRSDVIVLSLRPVDWQDLKVDARGKLLISVMAGVPLSALCQRHETCRVARSLPNAAAEVRRSYTPWIATGDVSQADREIVRAIFDACGMQDEVTSETELDYLTGLSGSGPAFPALLAAAMMDDAVRQGLDPLVARRAVNSVLIGTGRMLEQRDHCPTDTVETFLDYRGTTAAAIEAMRAAGFDAAIAEGLAAALKKSVSMGRGS